MFAGNPAWAACYCLVVKGVVRSVELRKGQTESCEDRSKPRTLCDYEEEYGKNYVVHFLHANPTDYDVTVADHLREIEGKTVLAPLLYFGGIFRDSGFEWGLGYLRSVSELDLARSLNEAECKRRIDSGQR